MKEIQNWSVNQQGYPQSPDMKTTCQEGQDTLRGSYAWGWELSASLAEMALVPLICCPGPKWPHFLQPLRK